MFQTLINKIEKPVHLAPLAVFRMIFGFMMLAAVIRFWSYGWISSLYIEPVYYFPYLGLEWIKPLGNPGMYILFAIMGISALGICLGFFYRWAAFVFFVLFSYVELIDKTPYLNHYYFICLVSFLLIFLPAHRFYSLDVKLGRVKPLTHVPAWMPGILKLQMGLVYFFAGIAKIESEWLIQALPLKIWLPARADLPVIGHLLAQEWVAYLFSWIGMLFDVAIPFILLSSRWRWVGYFFVVVFHLLTWLLFNIGMFPFVMIGCTLIFFSEKFHLRVIAFLQRVFSRKGQEMPAGPLVYNKKMGVFKYFLVVYVVIQLLVPIRYLLYPGHVFWTEEGFRFSWRVMLMEKAGHCTFYVCENDRQHCVEINNHDYLTLFQEKMMSTQPDMILQFAHHLREVYTNKKIEINGKVFYFRHPKIYVDAYVALNGRPSTRFIDPDVDLGQQPQNWLHKTWVIPFKE